MVDPRQRQVRVLFAHAPHLPREQGPPLRASRVIRFARVWSRSTLKGAPRCVHVVFVRSDVGAVIRGFETDELM